MICSQQIVPDMTFKISAGVCYESNENRYTVGASESISVTAANVTNPRIDISYELEGACYYLAGTPATSPVSPVLPSGALLLAEISVAANVTAITDAMIMNRTDIIVSEMF